MGIRNIVQARLAEVVAEHSAMPFPDAIDDDDEFKLLPAKDGSDATPPPVGWSSDAIRKFRLPSSLHINARSFKSFCLSRAAMTCESFVS